MRHADDEQRGTSPAGGSPADATFVVLGFLVFLRAPGLEAARGSGASQFAPGAGFSLTGTVDAPLRAGTRRPIDVVISNPFAFDLLVRRMEVFLAPATTAGGRPNSACSVDDPSPT